MLHNPRYGVVVSKGYGRILQGLFARSRQRLYLIEATAVPLRSRPNSGYVFRRGHAPGLKAPGRGIWGLEMTVGSTLLTWLIGGSALAALFKVLLAVCTLVMGLVCRRYLLILGADRRKPAERHVYDALRISLAEGNMAARLYAR